MKQRYNFDTVPRSASGFGVHADTKRQAFGLVYALAKARGYDGKLIFRDNMKCPKRNKNDSMHECSICNKTSNK